MAAADFYATGTRPDHRPSAAYLAPPAGPQRSSSHPNVNFGPQQFSQSPPYGQTPPYPSPQHRSTQPQYPSPPPPPAYEEPKPNVHFAPPPTSHPQRSSFSGQGPSPQYLQPPPQQYGPTVPYNPQNYAYQQPPAPAPHMRPYMHQNYSDNSLGGYSSDPENQRRRHKHRHERKRRISDHSRSSTADGFLGAAGGGLIGDLIFPGLGTVGGALVGWIGGKDYAESRKRKEFKRDMEQEGWEKHFGKENSPYNHDRRGSHDRRSSHDRRNSHDKRKGDY